MNISMIDSGIGGLTLLKRLLKEAPHNDYTYFADTYAHPYGSLGAEYLTYRLTAISELLYERGAELIVFACNTASSIALEEVKSALPVPVIGVRPYCSPARERTLIMCTPLTAKSELVMGYREEGALVYANGCLAPMVERYRRDLGRLEAYLEEELSPYKDLERVVLGCTHYIHIKDIIERVTGAESSDCLSPITEAVLGVADGKGTGSINFIFTGPSEEGDYRNIIAEEG